MTSTPPQPPAPPTHAAYTLLARAHSPTQATQIFTNKIKNKPLLLTPTTHNTTSDKRALRRHIRAHRQRYHQQHQKPRPLSAKEKRELDVYRLQPDEVTYETYRGLNDLWKGYILEVLGFVRDGEVVPEGAGRVVTAAGQGSLIASADFHGMEVEVVRCRDPGRVGVKGIVVRETKGTVVVVTEKDRQRRILKNGAVFRVVVDLPVGGVHGQVGSSDTNNDGRQLVFELHGNQLEIRPVERATRKFKWRAMDYL